MSSNSVRRILKRIAEQQIPHDGSSLYSCRNANFGAYLLTANLLRYKCAQLTPNGEDVDLLFYDPDRRGPDLLRRYNAGAAELVNARVLYEVRGFLLSEVKQLQGGHNASRKAL